MRVTRGRMTFGIVNRIFGGRLTMRRAFAGK